jgi:hypothetical protein
MNEMDLIDIYRIYYPIAAQYIFLSAAHETFSKIDISHIQQVFTNSRKLKLPIVFYQTTME